MFVSLFLSFFFVLVHDFLPFRRQVLDESSESKTREALDEKSSVSNIRKPKINTHEKNASKSNQCFPSNLQNRSLHNTKNKKISNIQNKKIYAILIHKPCITSKINNSP